MVFVCSPQVFARAIEWKQEEQKQQCRNRSFRTAIFWLPRCQRVLLPLSQVHETLQSLLLPRRPVFCFCPGVSTSHPKGTRSIKHSLPAELCLIVRELNVGPTQSHVSLIADLGKVLELWEDPPSVQTSDGATWPPSSKWIRFVCSVNVC